MVTEEKTEHFDLEVTDKINALAVFTEIGVDDALIKKVKAAAYIANPDTSTTKGRDEIRKRASDVAKFKVAADNKGKDLVADMKKKVGVIDLSRKKVRDELDKIKVETRKPLTDWEAEDKKRKEALKLQALKEIDHAAALVDNEQWDKAKELELRQQKLDEEDAQRQKEKEAEELKAKVKKELEEKAEKERLDALKKRAEAEARAEKAEKDRIAAEEKAEKERIAAKKKAEDDRIAAEKKAEEDRVAAEKKAERDKAEAAKKAEADKKAALEKIELEKKQAAEKAELEKKQAAERAEKEKQDAIEAERKKAQDIEDARLAKEAADKQKAEQRAANIEHVRVKNNESLDDILAAVPEITKEAAQNLIKSIYLKKIRNITIHY